MPGPDPMPGPFSRIDDPWGVAWQARMIARRIEPRTVGRFLRALTRGRRHERPVFVVGVPRSGTTGLMRVLEQSGELCSPSGGSHLVWLAFHHPRWSGWASGAIGPGEVRPGERRFVNSFYFAHCGPRRFVDKAPANSLRIPHILEIFPDAVIVAVRRDPCDVISALIKGWRHPEGHFRSYYVPEDLRIPGYPHRRQWRFALVPGWRELIGRPIPEIAFAQWERISHALEAARSTIPAERWIDLHLEDLRERPGASVSALCEQLGIAHEQRMTALLERLNEHPVGSTSPPAAAKWRRENPDELYPLLPMIAAAAPARGYRVDPETGDCEIQRPAGAGAAASGAA